MSPSPKTPKALGYRFPAEWEPQEAIWFAWPVRESLWPGCFDAVRNQLAGLYVLAARFQPVRVLCAAPEQPRLRSMMAAHGDASAVELYDYQSDDVWIRDFGPLFLVNDQRSELGIADWRYNAWGNKFPNQSKDDAASAWMSRQLNIPCFASDQVLEGGAIESNGAGLLLTTEAVLLNPSRNGPTTLAEVEEKLIAGLGVEKVLWLGDGLAGDDTDGHIDNIARFFKADGILIADVADPADSNYAVLQENFRRLRNFRVIDGCAMDVVPLPLPDPITHDGEPLAASYLNYVVLNGAILVPTYGQPENDSQAIQILTSCFPGREVIGVDCREIIKEGGALHCMSQHQPALI
ncbi:MAG: agmatine deiminase family protein [Puniceicoccaceae bacterium]|nr:MAG: agmatine deiminase family protein [Puniceicoccaceae bacterium]